MLSGFGFVVVLPIVWLLLAHQRKMAELYNRPGNPANEDRLLRIEHQLSELRQLVYEQTLRLDDRSTATQPPPLQDRLKQS